MRDGLLSHSLTTLLYSAEGEAGRGEGRGGGGFIVIS